MTTSPLNDVESTHALDPGEALCLSGGGYRAMMFHVGVLWRLYESGRLARIKRISSVSGGSITAGVLALAWPRLSFAGEATDFATHVAAPLHAMASRTLDADAIVGGLFSLGSSIGDKVTAAYARYLFGDATLQDLPDTPRFVINATNVQSGVLWRFSKPYMGDYRVGRVLNPTLPLARAVAASSAFPPVLSPVTIELDPSDFLPASGMDLQQPPFTTDLVLADGGVYDNMGLETVWKNFQSVLISDAGAKMQAEAEPKQDWARHAYRILDLVDNQVRSLRKRQVMAGYKAGPGHPDARGGAYWGIGTNYGDYVARSVRLACDPALTAALAKVPTRLKRMDEGLQQQLVNWGYAVCDAALRTYVDPALPDPEGFPYPTAAVT